MTQSSGQVTRAFLVQCTSWRLYFGTDWVRTRWQTTVTAFRIIALASLLKWMIQNKNDFRFPLTNNLSLVWNIGRCDQCLNKKTFEVELYLVSECEISHLKGRMLTWQHFSRPVYLSKTLFWHLRNWFARFSSSWEPKEFESANRKKWKNGLINYLTKNKRDLSSEELINQLVPITVAVQKTESNQV